MQEVKINNKKIMSVDAGIVIGLIGEKNVNLFISGEISLNEVLDMINTATYEIISTFLKKAGDNKKIKEEIYNRAVMGFSLMIDKFHPEGIKSRFNGLTEEAIIKAQNDILRDKQK